MMNSKRFLWASWSWDHLLSGAEGWIGAHRKGMGAYVYLNDCAVPSRLGC